MKGVALAALTIALAVACAKSKEAKENDADKPVASDAAAKAAEKNPTASKPGADAAAETVAPEPAAGDGSVAASMKLEARCEEACLLLTDHKLSELTGGGFCKLCDKFGVYACGVDGIDPFENDCEGLDFQRNCIYAAHGYKFKKKKWQRIFGGRAWYEPRDDFKESELSKLETSNIAALRKLEKRCARKKLGPVSKKDRKLVEAYFKDRTRRKFKLPKQLYIVGEKVSEKEFRELWDSESLAAPHPDHQILYKQFKGGWIPLDPKKHRAINVMTVSKKCAKKPENCEAQDIVTLIVNRKNKVVAIALDGISACPYVYVGADNGELAFAGEVLRYLHRPELEASESLELKPDIACGRTVTVRIAEEKREVTYLDSIALIVGGELISPRECADLETAFCDDDQRYELLEPGESRTLTFEIPAALRCEPASLRANGYYVPIR